MIPLSSDTFFVDNSMIDLITTCPWLAYASIVRRRRPAGDSAPLRFGGFLHVALAYRYRMQGFNAEFKENSQIRILEHSFSHHPSEFEGWRNYDNAVKVIRGYNAYYPKEDFDVDINPLTGFPYVEQPFAVDTHKVIRGRQLIYMGRIDVKVKFPDNSRFTLDHKTTSMLGDTFWQDQQMTGQHLGYLYADRECTGEEATGYIVNAIGAKESLANAEFDPILGKLIPGLTNSGRKSTATPLELARQRFYTKVPPGQIDDWFENMTAEVDRFLYNVDADYYPRHRCQCIRKYGPCQFFNVCSLPPQSREPALMSGAYVENDWTPLYK